MISATFPRRRARIAAAGASLVAVLVLTGCGGDGDSGGSGDSSAPDSSASATDGGSGKTGARSELDGSWVTTADGKPVALVISGKKAALFTSDETICSGTAGKETGMRMIKLKCANGDKDRTYGRVDSADAKTLKVSWEGFGDETYTKSEAGSLPTGLPTETLGFVRE
ncbi:hypothetical protein ACFY93_23200 [Streptomyces sp. NPDC008313]|uniref:hypothetical protein n=1 Tax=Streptomyces sp. NPDC008313 TaxID=3364826 RepID=UPI0036EEDF37